MIKDKDYLDFKEKYDELVNIFNIASIVEVACLARESVDKIQQCASTIVNKGKILSTSYGKKAEEYVQTLDLDSYELINYKNAIDAVDEMFEDSLSLIIAEEKRAEALYENAIITKARLEHQRTAAMTESEFVVYKAELDKINSKIKATKKLKNEVEKTKKLATILEEKENLTDRTPLISFNQQIDDANRQIETALLEIEESKRALERLNKDYQDTLDMHISKAGDQKALVEQKEEGSIFQLFKKIIGFLKGGRVRQFQDYFDTWILGQINDLNKESQSKFGNADRKFEDLEQKIDYLEQDNLGRLIGTGRNLVESVKSNLNRENRVGSGIKTGVVVIIKAQDTIGKTNGDKMFDGLEEIIDRPQKTSSKVTKKASAK